MFNQPLAPRDAGRTTVLQRPAIATALRSLFEAPPEPIVGVVLGHEGCGKSWVVAQTWLGCDRKPLMVVLGADEFADGFWQRDVNDRLIAKLIEQSGDRFTEAGRERWRRRVDQWRSVAAADHPRLMVIVDGINQKPEIDWGRVLDSLAADLHALGGSLIVTSRTPYFRDRVVGRLVTRPVEIIVPEWTPAERDDILRGRGVDPATIQQDVATSLQNPRMLGIALDILGHDIAALEELSISRLLFEHMRASERDAPSLLPANTFARRLQEHAQIVLDRIQRQQTDDLRVFESEAEAVADGRFFHGLAGEPGRYEIHEDGLTLALGFSLADLLRVAKRRGRNLEESLATVLEPVAALDDTADVLLAALNVTSVDDDAYDADIAAALVSAFAELQNPDQTKHPAFAAMARRRPQGFLAAAARLCATGGHQPNFDWVHAAIHAARDDDAAWPVISAAIRSWLSTCSLAPELGMTKRPEHDAAEQVEEDRLKRKKAIDDKLAALSPGERHLYDRLSHIDEDPSALWRLGLYLLAGKPLAPFASALVNWSFAYALNSHHSAPYSDFLNLVSLNLVDWKAARIALVTECTALRDRGVSPTGQWALNTLYRATGAPEDAEKARVLIDELTKDRPKFEGWRLIEKYCASDPCDPGSAKPDNIGETASGYAAIDPSKLHIHMGLGMEDHFFRDARPGVARFEPAVAVGKHREYAQDVLNRTGHKLKQGLYGLRAHHALLSRDYADALLTKWRERDAANSLAGISENEAWFTSLYHILLAFPFLSFEEKLEALIEASKAHQLTVEIVDMIGAPDQTIFDRAFDTAWEAGDDDQIYVLLVVAKATRIALSANVHHALLSLLTSSTSDRLRTQALGLAGQSGDHALLTAVAGSDWNAAAATAENGYEAWYGSWALLEAAARGIVGDEDALQRISPRLYGRAVQTFNDADARLSVAHRIDASIRRAIGFDGMITAPDIEKLVRSDRPEEPSLCSLRERETPSKDLRDLMRKLDESTEEFEEKQRRSYHAYVEFDRQLSVADARVIVDELSIDAFNALVAAAPDLADQWYRLFVALPDARIPLLQPLMLALAHVFAANDPEKAKALFSKAEDGRPVVRYVYRAGVPLDAKAVWDGDRNDILDQQRRGRLDRATTDAALFDEVLAASAYGKQDFLSAYIDEKVGREEPAEIARGIMVAGFSDEGPHASEILSRFADQPGLLGAACRAAHYAYERNAWARHWYAQMAATEDTKVYWQSQVQFEKIVDTRFELWRNDHSDASWPMKQFRASSISNLSNTYRNRQSKRDKKLFGRDAPAPIFVTKLLG